MNGIRICGGLTYWTVAEATSRPALLDALAVLGKERFAPEARTGAACLKDALNEVFKERAYLVRPLAKKDGFAVVREARGEQANDYVHELTVTVKDEQLSFRPAWHSRDGDVERAYRDQLGLLARAQVTDVLTVYLHSLGGTQPYSEDGRKKGGLYWLPTERIEEWQAVARVFEAASVRGRTNVYLFRPQMDADAVRAVRDAVMGEVAAASKKIHDEIASGELGERALAHRRGLLGDLRSKIGLYEEILEVGLGDLRESVETVEQGLAMAELAVSAGVSAGAGA